MTKEELDAYREGQKDLMVEIQHIISSTPNFVEGYLMIAMLCAKILNINYGKNSKNIQSKT